MIYIHTICGCKMLCIYYYNHASQPILAIGNIYAFIHCVCHQILFIIMCMVLLFSDRRHVYNFQAIQLAIGGFAPACPI